MIFWSVMLLVVALVAAVLGFSGVSVAAAGAARILFGVFLLFFLASLLMQFLYSA